ncbi:MAG: hypothetical protein WB866_13465, partial [Solirubrobacterales bacterium]
MVAALTYERLQGDLHRHGGGLTHSHPHRGPHTHEVENRHEDRRGHSHGLVDPSIRRSREGIRAVLLSLLVLGVAAGAQTLIYIATSSVALLADLIHNFGDAATAIP